MFKKCTYIFSLILVFIYTLPSLQVNATTLYKGTFVDVAYENVRLSDETIEKRLKTVTIKNNSGKTTTLNIDKFAELSVNARETTIDAFKLGMSIEADVNLRKVEALRGFTASSQSKTDAIGKQVNGTVNRVDKNGKFISVRLDDGQSQSYFINEDTVVYKDSSLSDLSVIYEGDRVKLKLVEHDSRILHSIEVNTQGIIIENLYKGTIQRIDPVQKKIVIKNEKVFRDWKWQSQIPVGNTSKNYSAKTPIYVGNKEVTQQQLRYYGSDEVYYVTISQFGKEVIQKMVIKRLNERTFYEPMISINTATKKIGLKTAGVIPYHLGSIIIRNGRLVDPFSLQSSGTAFVVTDGTSSSQFANIIHVTNDGFQSPNLADHTLYYGKINTATSYNLTLSNVQKLTNHYWSSAPTARLTFSNDTHVVEDFGRSVLSVVPRNEMDNKEGTYGYFYVKNNHIISAHLVSTSTSLAQLVSVGRLETTIDDKTLRVQNVSHWQQGIWKEAGKIYSMNVEQTTFIKDGKVISIKDLKANDRLFMIHESIVKGRIIFVD